jgi:hypothetical protein
MATPETTTNGGERLRYSTKETAQCIREALKSAFPGFRFSVTTSYASMTSSTHIKWTDGPTEPEVERITNRFTSKSFDGMTDSTNYHEQIVAGQRVQYSGWVTTRRDYSVALLDKALGRFQAERARFGLPAVNVTVKANGSYPFIEGPDANAEAGTGGRARYVSDAVYGIAHTMRPNGCRVTMKDEREPVEVVNTLNEQVIH